MVLAPFANMPDDVKAKAEASKKAIADGTLHPFKGPVLKQDGSVAVKEGETAPDPDDPRHELVCEGHRRQAAELTPSHL